MITLKRLEEISSQFSSRRLLVYGDTILDRYIFGDVLRISPEAPVPVVTVKLEEERIGGAGNVAANIDALGASSVLLGVCGQDAFAERLRQLKARDNWLVASTGTPTIVKTRIIAGKQHLARLDREERHNLDDGLLASLQEKLSGGGDQFHGIVVSDYAKGAVVRPMMDVLRLLAERLRIPLVVDPKPANWRLYRGVSGLTPNLREAEEMSGRQLGSDPDIFRALPRLRKKLRSDFMVITRGAEGISAGRRGERQFSLPAHGHEVFDVTGAGDTVVAVLTLVLSCGGSLREAVALANGAASIVVERVGTAQVTLGELMMRMRYLHRKH